MRVLVSCMSLDGSFSGYRTILRNMILESSSRRDYEYFFVIPQRGFDSLAIGDDIPNNVILTKYDFKNKWARGLYEQFLINFLAVKYRCDRIFMPSTFGLIFPVKKTTTFVHTNTSFAVGETLRARSRIQQFAHYLLSWITIKTSEKLVFTSAITRSELEAFFKKKIGGDIVGNGIYMQPMEKDSPCIVDGPFVLTVSQFYRLKNFEKVIESFVELKSSSSIDSDVKLVLVGTVQEEDYYQELKSSVVGREDVVFLSAVSDSDLLKLFEKAIVYTFLSRFEGYSLTPAQALLLNTPCVLSDIPVHQEVYGEMEGVFFVDPDDVSDISEKIKRFLNVQELRSGFANDACDKFSFQGFMDRLEVNFE